MTDGWDVAVVVGWSVAFGTAVALGEGGVGVTVLARGTVPGVAVGKRSGVAVGRRSGTTVATGSVDDGGRAVAVAGAVVAVAGKAVAVGDAVTPLVGVAITVSVAAGARAGAIVGVGDGATVGVSVDSIAVGCATATVAVESKLAEVST